MTTATDSLELRIERINSLANMRLKLFECFNNKRPIIERYLTGDFVVHLHGLARDYRFCLVCRARSDEERAINDGEMPMLVWIREFPEYQRPVASVARLQCANQCDMGITDSAKIHAFPPPVADQSYTANESLAGVFDRKLCALYDLLGIQTGQLIDEVIQGTAQIVDNLSNKDADSQGYRAEFLFRKRVCKYIHDGLLRLTIENSSSCDYWASQELTDHALKITQVFAAPSDPLVRAIQRVHMLYSNHAREEDAKDTAGTRDTHTKPRGLPKEPRPSGENPQEILTASTLSGPELGTERGHRRGDYTAKHTRLGSLEDA